MAGMGGSKNRFLVLSASAIAAVVAGSAIGSDAAFNRGFNKALEVSRPELTFTASNQQVGDEGYWLTRAEVESPATLMKPLSVGDRITISGSDGRVRKLEVVDLKAVGADPVVRTGAGATPMRLLVVTCRIAESKDEALVRFIIEAEHQPPAPPPAPAPAKAL